SAERPTPELERDRRVGSEGRTLPIAPRKNVQRTKDSQVSPDRFLAAIMVIDQQRVGPSALRRVRSPVALGMTLFSAISPRCPWWRGRPSPSIFSCTRCAARSAVGSLDGVTGERISKPAGGVEAYEESGGRSARP